MFKHLNRNNFDTVTDIATYATIGTMSAVGVGVVAPALSIAVGVTATSLLGASLVGASSIKVYSKFNKLMKNIKDK